MAENNDKQQQPNATQKGAQREAGDEALEGNTGAGNDVPVAQDSDGNTGVMTNDDFEKGEVEGGGTSLRDPEDTGGKNSQSAN